MEITLRHYGAYGGNPSNIIEIIVNSTGASITEDITASSGKVDEKLIANLREVADELEEQNKLIESNK